MSKKPTKSIQAIIITLAAGMLLPKVFDISSNALVNKFLWKGLITLSFSISTVAVGVLYARKFIKGRVAGGKSRISIFLILLALLASLSSAICAFIREISSIIEKVLSLFAILAMTLLIVKLIRYCFDVKRHFKRTQEESLSIKEAAVTQNMLPKNIRGGKTTTIVPPNTREIKTIPQRTIDAKKVSSATLATKTSPTPQKQTISYPKSENKTLFELWNKKSAEEKCLTVTNDMNPNLKWIKIYKPPYRNGKFYGYVMMCNAYNTVSGEIYYADRPIWRRY